MTKKGKGAVPLALAGSDVEDIIAKLNDKFGINTLVQATKVKNHSATWFSTGIAALDFALGGGFPENRISELNGNFSSGKTSIALSSCAQWQKKHPKGTVLYVDMERTFDPVYSARFGINTANFLVASPDSGEDAGDIVIDALGMDTHILIVIDSLAAMVPLAVMEQSVQQQHMALHARLVGKIISAANGRMRRSTYTNGAPTASVLVLNQVREKVGVVYGDPIVTPGGRAKDFFYSVTVRLTAPPSKRIEVKRVRNSVTQTVTEAKTITFDVKKNKCHPGSEGDGGEFVMQLVPSAERSAPSFHNDPTLFEHGVYYGIIKQNAKRFSYGQLNGLSEAAFKKSLVRNSGVADSLRQEILDALRVARRNAQAVEEGEEDDA